MNHNIIMTADFTYDPADPPINVGDTVTWENQSEHPHSATKPDGSHYVNRVNPGQTSEPVAFDTAGHFEYHCRFHEGMEGAVTVNQ